MLSDVLTKNIKVLSRTLTWVCFHYLEQSIMKAMEGCRRSSALNQILLIAEGWPEPMSATLLIKA